MCGRFTLTVSPEELQAAFPNFNIPGDIPPSYNIAPSQPIPVIPNDGKNHLDFYRWGLIPSWTKADNLGKFNLINARSETAAEKPSFKNSFRRRRCLVLADGFYEWSKSTAGNVKTPYYFTLKDQTPFAFAGLWEIWNSPEGDLLKSACILTTTPNEVVKPVHDRMPVILHPENYETWLSPIEGKPEDFQPFLKPFPGNLMQAYPVSPFVNSPKNNSPQCIQASAFL
ncbi:MAG: SOS response-associated peptidase [Anaerolineales bacterium]|nr:SOS response-associated peptidase [Anaerolineales bacterium]